jgi:hypothetical protein
VVWINGPDFGKELAADVMLIFQFLRQSLIQIKVLQAGFQKLADSQITSVDRMQTLLKEQCREIFRLRFFSSNNFS